MCGSYVTSLAAEFIHQSRTELTTDMISAIMSEISIPMAMAGEENIMLIETKIQIEGVDEDN